MNGKQRIAYPVSVALLAMMAATAVSAASPSFPDLSRGEIRADGLAPTAAWSATNYCSGATLRRVVVSGYHPAEGFEAEHAAEQAQARRSPLLAQR